MADDWNSTVAKAKKVLGDKAKIPDAKFLPKLGAEYDKAWAGFMKAREDLEAKVLDMQNLESRVKNTITQFADKLDEDDLGLDDSDKEDAKKIKEAHDIFSAYWQKILDIRDGNMKNLDELDKHLMNIAKYKGKPVSE